MENFPSQDETSLGVLDYNAVRTSLQKETLKKKRKNSWFSDEERYQIGKYASIYRPTAAVKSLKSPTPRVYVLGKKPFQAHGV